MRKDLFEFAYDLSGKARAILRVYLKVKEWVLGNVRPSIKEKFEVGRDPQLRIIESGSQPSAEFEINLVNNNFTPIEVEGINLQLSLGREGSFFDSFYWHRDDFSDPPKNIFLEKIEGHDEGQIRIQTMLPYYLYFPNENHFSGKDSNTIRIFGTLKLKSDAGEIKKDVRIQTRLEHEQVTETTAQDRLKECFEIPS